MAALRQPNAREQLARPVVGRAAGEFHRDLHIFQRGERGDELERLEHEAYLFPPQAGALILVHSPRSAPSR
jgi:hypothetical protein